MADIEAFGAKHKAFSLDFCSAVMMRVDEEDSVDSVADEGGDDDDDDGDEGQGDEDEEDDDEKKGDDECHREVDGFVDSFAPSQQTLGMEKGHGSTKHFTSEATRGLARVSHHLSQNRTKRGEGGLGD